MELAPEMVPFVVGTPRSAGKTGKTAFSAAALLDIDVMLSLPDFRAYEKTFQEAIRIANTIVPDGTLFLQTRDPGNAILKFIRERDFKGFQDHELTQRRAVAYPPFSRIILFNIFVEKDSPELMGLLERALVLKPGEHPEVLGPQELPNMGKNSGKCIQIVLKSSNRKLVHEAAWELLRNLAKIGGIRVVTDVDPYRI
jgi:primosomal protein N' (replication factor Y)